jgi:hypothetical protein
MRDLEEKVQQRLPHDVAWRTDVALDDESLVRRARRHQ